MANNGNQNANHLAQRALELGKDSALRLDEDTSEAVKLCSLASLHVSTTPVSVILGIGAATPERVVSMKTYARDFGENLGLSEASIQFAERICNSSQITTKYLAIPFKRYSEHSNLQEFGAPSLDIRLGWYEEEAVKMAERAATKALENWGGQKCCITHIIVYSTSGAMSPGIDLRLMKVLKLPRSTKHFWVSFNGCHAGVMGIRTAAEIAQSDSSNRVLVVWVEVNSCQAQPPDPEDEANNVVVASIFGDGAAAMVVGTQMQGREMPRYEIHRCKASYIPDSEGGIVARLTQAGLNAGLGKEVPGLVGEHVAGFVEAMLEGTGLSSKAEGLQWAVHPGGRAILDAVQVSCGLVPHQLSASRTILEGYSNMGAPTIVFLLQMLPLLRPPPSWTLALAFGPGISMEGALLRSLQHPSSN